MNISILGVVVFFAIACALVLLAIGRYSILEIQQKDSELFSKIMSGNKCFPINKFKRMNIEVQMNLYKYLYKNDKNSVVLVYQKYFRTFLKLLFVFVLIFIFLIIAFVAGIL